MKFLTEDGINWFISKLKKCITTDNISQQHVNYANSAGAVNWNNVASKPSTFPPATHNHDDMYYTETEMNTKLDNKQHKLDENQLKAVNSGITSAEVSKLDALPTSTQLDGNLSSKANKSDITNISITGTTNNTGSNILVGTLFYLNGTLCKTLVDVADGATFTEGTNYASWSLKNTQEVVSTALIPGRGRLAIDKVGKLCIIRTIVNIEIPAGSHPGYDIVVEEDLPSGFRPIGYNRSFVVSNNKNVYAIEVQSDYNRLIIITWSEEPITVAGNEIVQFSLPYFTND